MIFLDFWWRPSLNVIITSSTVMEIFWILHIFSFPKIGHSNWHLKWAWPPIFRYLAHRLILVSQFLTKITAIFFFFKNIFQIYHVRGHISANIYHLVMKFRTVLKCNFCQQFFRFWQIEIAKLAAKWSLHGTL